MTEIPPVSLVKDAEAPYGRKADGTPKAKPGRRAGSPGSGGSGTGAPRARKVSGPDYRPGIVGLFQLIAFPVSLAEPADAAVITHYAPGIAEALNDLAKVRPEVAAALDRVLAAGPYGAVIAACLPMVIQLAVNHGALPYNAFTAMGIVPKEKILADLGISVKPKTEPEAA